MTTERWHLRCWRTHMLTARASLPVVAIVLAACAKPYEPRGYVDVHARTGTPQMRVECWDAEDDCEREAVHRCGSYKGRPRGIRVLDRRTLQQDGGRPLIMLEIECAP